MFSNFRCFNGSVKSFGKKMCIFVVLSSLGKLRKKSGIQIKIKSVKRV